MIEMIAHAVALGLLGLCFVAFSAASYQHFRAAESRGNTAIRLLTLLASAGFAAHCVMSPVPQLPDPPAMGSPPASSSPTSARSHPKLSTVNVMENPSARDEAETVPYPGPAW